jgi:ABC-type oligopeptide transport system substrate-binding subunit
MARVRGAKALAAGEATELSGFTILSPSELTIELGEPLQIFPTLLSDPVTGILPEGSFPDRLSWKEGFVGTGPFRLVKFEPGSRVELEANPAYWREGLPRSEGLIFHLKEPPDEIVSGFRAGRFALASDLRPDQVESLRRDPVFGPRHRQKPRLCTYLLAANIRGGPLSDRAYRRRLMAAIDVHGLVLRHLGGVALPASGLIPPGILPRRRTDLTPLAQLPPEPHEAGEPLVANVHPAFEEEYGLLALELFSSLSARGFDVLHPRREISEYMDHHRAGTSDLLLGRWVADYPDPDTFAGILHSRSGGLGHYCGTKELDDLIEQAAAERDPATRRALYLRLEEHIREEALLLPLFHEQLYRFVRPEVMGFELSFTSPNVAYERLSLDS